MVGNIWGGKKILLSEKMKKKNTALWKEVMHWVLASKPYGHYSESGVGV